MAGDEFDQGTATRPPEIFNGLGMSFVLPKRKANAETAFVILQKLDAKHAAELKASIDAMK